MDTNVIVGFVLSGIISYIIPKISPYIDKKVRDLGIFLQDRCFDPVKGFFRKKRLNRLLNLRVTRKNSAAVTFQIVKAQAYFLLFWGVIFFYIYLLIQTNYAKVFESNFWLGLCSSIPIYCFEIAWLNAAGKAKKLVRQWGRSTHNKRFLEHKSTNIMYKRRIKAQALKHQKE